MTLLISVVFTEQTSKNFIGRDEGLGSYIKLTQNLIPLTHLFSTNHSHKSLPYSCIVREEEQPP